jgi:hypothetical protein
MQAPGSEEENLYLCFIGEQWEQLLLQQQWIIILQDWQHLRFLNLPAVRWQ